MEMVKGSSEYLRFRERINNYRKNLKFTNPEAHKKLKEGHRRFYLKNADRIRGYKSSKKTHSWDWYLKKKYNLTKEGYQYLFEAQNGVCAICDMPEKLKRRLAVDHSHSSGKIRGLLCHGCNTAIGLLKENISTLESAINYLKY